MSIRTLPLPDGIAGALWLGSMPGRLQPWPHFLAQARSVGLTRVVCLTPRDEVTAVSEAYDQALTQGTLPFAWMHLPMQNFSVGANLQAYREGVDSVVQGLREGEVILLHCAAGIGRTGTTAACVLKRLGLPNAEALQRVRRAGSSPESAVQSGLIDNF